MAYNLVLDTKFNPFTYDEMIKPVEAATKAHQALEEEYSNIAAKADILDRLANEQTSPLAYRMYKGFSDDLNERADQLMRYGLNTLSRKQLLDMRARYSKEIAPIEAAYTRREQLADEQRKALAQNPTLLFQRMASTMSLDDFIRNPSLDYGMSYSGALLTQQVANIAESLSKEARRGEEGMRIVKQILPYQYKAIANTGFSSEAIREAILNSPDADSILTGIVENVVNASGIKNWGDQYTINSAYNYARQGLYKAVGQTQYQILTDQYNMQNDLAAAEFQRQLDAQKQEDQAAYLEMWNIDPTSLYGESTVAEMNRGILEQLNKWRDKGYFTKNGKLTVAGLTALNTAKKKYDPYTGDYVGTEGDPDFKNWVEETIHPLNGQYDSTVSHINNRYSTLRRKIENGELVTGTPNIDVYRQSIRGTEDQEFVLGKVTSALGGGNIYEVGNIVVTDQGLTMNKGTSISAKDFEKLAKEYPIMYIINSPTTNNQLIELTNGQIFIMPKGIIGNDLQQQISNENIKTINATSREERATALNRSNSYLGSILDYNKGTARTPSDGMMTIPITGQ